MKRRIVLLGPPASGKGTQAEMIRSKYQLPVTSPGAIFREERRNGTNLGRAADQLTSQGQLVPDKLVNSVVETWLERNYSAFVFDGYPRSRGQADALDEMLAVREAALQVVLSLEIDSATIRRRVEARLVCEDCGRITSFAAGGACCAICGGALTKRADDTAEALERRLVEYATKTEPLVAHYRGRGLLQAIPAAGAPEEVFRLVCSSLEVP